MRRTSPANGCVHALPAILLASTAAHAAPAAPDSIPPTIASARVVFDPNDPSDTALFEFVFSEPVEWFGAILPANYLDVNGGGTADQGSWFPPNRTQIRFPAGFDFGSCERIRVTNVLDEAGNAIVDDGVGNAFTFHLQEWLVRGRMNGHMAADDAPPHAFAMAGPATPLDGPACSVPLADADGDSIWTRTLFFDVPCTTAASGPETRDVAFRFTHQCNEAEPLPSDRLVTLDLAAHPDGRDTLDLWWNDEASPQVTAQDMDVIFRVGASSLLPPFGSGDSVAVVGSEFPLSWDDPPLVRLLDDGVAPDDSAGDGVLSGRVTFPAGTYRHLLYRFLHKGAADSVFAGECAGEPRAAFLDDTTFSKTMPLPIDAFYDDCLSATAAPELRSVTAGAMLRAPFPNPARGDVRVAWSLPARGRVVVRIVDVGGRVVRRLVRGELPAGAHEWLWDGRAVIATP
ncbi:hypothetical protein K8I85_11835, partial [bacterium]|nr:hypothetical protein [bacterium]